MPRCAAPKEEREILYPLRSRGHGGGRGARRPGGRRNFLPDAPEKKRERERERERFHQEKTVEIFIPILYENELMWYEKKCQFSFTNFKLCGKPRFLPFLIFRKFNNMSPTRNYYDIFHYYYDIFSEI